MFFAARQLELTRKREALRERSAMLRANVAEDAQVLAPPLRLADRAIVGWQWVRRHPEAVVAGVVVIAIVRPRGAWAIMRLTWRGWQAWRWLRSISLQAGLAASAPTATR